MAYEQREYAGQGAGGGGGGGGGGGYEGGGYVRGRGRRKLSKMLQRDLCEVIV